MSEDVIKKLSKPGHFLIGGQAFFIKNFSTPGHIEFDIIPINKKDFELFDEEIED